MSIVPASDWTMEKRGAKIVPIANTEDKRQPTAVLAVSASGVLKASIAVQRKNREVSPYCFIPGSMGYLA